MDKETLRKLFHIFSILSLLIPLFLFGKYSVTVLMVVALLITYPVSKFGIKNKLAEPFWIFINLLERKENLDLPAKEAFSLAVALIIITLFFDEKIVAISIISLAVYDGFATLIGKRFGKVTILNGRTLEGTLGGILANTFALSFFIDVFTAILISIFVAFIENVSPKGKDNFYIPVGTAFFTYFLFLYLNNFTTTY